MRLTSRQTKIIQLLSRNSDGLTGASMLHELDCSLRTLRSEISTINQNAGGKLILSSNKGYLLDTCFFDTLTFETERPEKQDIYLLLKAFLFDREEWDLYDLEDTFYMSSGTLTNRLKAANQLLQEYNLQLSIKNGRVALRGKEYDKCQLINHLILAETTPAFLNLENCSDYFVDMDIPHLKQLVRDAISKHEYYIEDFYAENLYLNIIIALSRMRRNYHIEPIDNFHANTDSTEYQIAQSICAAYAQHYPSFTCQENDIRYIAMIITGHVKSRFFKERNVLLSDSVNQDFIDIVTEALTQTFHHYMLNIDQDSFLSSFLLHIHALIQRARTGQYLQDLTIGNLRDNCPFIYDVAVFLTKQLEDAFAIHIPDSEIGYIAIHIGFAIETATRESDAIKILLICSDYHDNARQILEKLRQEHSSDIEIIQIASLYEHSKLNNSTDLIVTTIPLQMVGKNIIEISPFYTTVDALHVDSAIKACQKEKESRKLHQLLLSSFHEKLFFINDELRTKEDAIRFLGGQIEDFGLAPSGFTDSCLQREQTSSTCFFNLFAIPHALQMNARKTMFAVLISPSGILWDDDVKIHLIFMITVNAHDRKEFMKIYNSIIQYLWDKDKAYTLAQVRNFHEFLDFFQ